MKLFLFFKYKVMSNLKYWEDKIKEKRKNTDFKVFLKEIASWYPL
jgi:hypothetical protein